MERIEKSLQDVASSNHLTLKRSNQKTHDFEMEDEQRIYLFKIVLASPYYEIVITNQQRWYLNVMKDISKASKQKRVLQEVVPFTLHQHKSTKQVKKVAIIYPDVQKIVRYINESEVVFVTSNVDVWGYKIIRYPNLKAEFHQL